MSAAGAAGLQLELILQLIHQGDLLRIGGVEHLQPQADAQVFGVAVHAHHVLQIKRRGPAEMEEAIHTPAIVTTSPNYRSLSARM